MDIPPEVEAFYALGEEAGRLGESYFPLEKARTEELLARHLPLPPAVLLDVGGAAGAYALDLAARGYAVHLIDPVPLHIEQARRASAAAARPLTSVRLGEARSLVWGDGTVDAVLLLGPLYHLVAREDRRRALGEARRVLRADGLLFAAAISRFASLIDGLSSSLLADPQFERIVRRDIVDGQHRNDTGKPQYFTTAYFHRPEELAAEVVEVGFAAPEVFAVEGPGAFLRDFRDWWEDPDRRRRLLALVRTVEREPSLLALSPHLLAVARVAP